MSTLTHGLPMTTDGWRASPSKVPGEGAACFLSWSGSGYMACLHAGGGAALRIVRTRAHVPPPIVRSSSRAGRAARGAACCARRSRPGAGPSGGTGSCDGGAEERGRRGHEGLHRRHPGAGEGGAWGDALRLAAPGRVRAGCYLQLLLPGAQEALRVENGARKKAAGPGAGKVRPGYPSITCAGT